MALYDQRTFKHGDSWWVAEVHAAAGASTGSGRPALTFESALFTNLTEPDAKSLSNRLPGGLLNRLSHRAVVALLLDAEPLSGRFEISPRNAPDADELSDLSQVRDADGLLWVYRVVNRPEWSEKEISMRPVLEFICLEDSALRGEVAFNGQDVLDDFVRMHGEGGIRSLIQSVTQAFQDLDPEWDT